MNVFIIALVLVWLASAGTAAFIASEKGRDGLSWFVSGVLFGIFALIAVAASPAVWEKPKSKPLGKASDGPSALHSGKTDRKQGTAATITIGFVVIIAGGIIVALLINADFSRQVQQSPPAFNGGEGAIP